MPRVITALIIADFRKRLCDIASQLLAEQGMDGFNMRELAKRLRVSPMTAYRYFNDKNEILAHLRARGFARLADLLEEAQALPTTPQDATAALMRAYVRFALEEQVNYRLMFDMFQPGSHDLPELALHRRRVRTVMTDHAALLVHRAVIAGEPEIIGQLVGFARSRGAAPGRQAGRGGRRARRRGNHASVRQCPPRHATQPADRVGGTRALP